MNQRNTVKANASFPITTLPNLPEWKYDKKRNLGLGGYGSWEAVDVEVVNDCEIVYAKKSRPCSLLPEEISAVLEPRQDQGILCEGKSQTDCGLLDDIVMTKQLIPKVFDYKYRCTILPTESKFLSAVETSSKVLTSELKDFLKANSRDRSIKKWMRRKLGCRLEQEMILRHFDPTCLGIGKKPFSDLVQEDCKNTLKDHFNNEGSVGGGCLSYRHVCQSSSGNLGVVVSVEGDGMYELCVKAVFSDSGNASSRTSDSNEYGINNMNIESCGEITQTLNGKIYNIDCVSGNNGAVLFSVLSDYHVVVNSLRGDGITFDWERRDARFSKNSLCSSVLKTNHCAPFSSVVLNPYIHGECAVATKNGLTGIWQTERPTNDDAFHSILQLNVHYDNEKISLKQISFGAHPRQFFGCNHNSLYLFDIRSQNSPSCLFDARNSSSLIKPEHIHASQSCKPAGSEYEIIVATDNNILILDQRYSREPLLKWDAVSEFPACYLKCLAAPCKEGPTDVTGSNCQFSNSILLTGGMITDKVYYYQMRRLGKCINDKQHSYAPVSVAPPRTLCPSPASPKSFNIKLKNCMPQHNSLKHVISGFDGFAFEGHGSSGVCVFQLTSNGEIFYQTLGWKKNNDEEVENIGTQHWADFSNCEAASVKSANVKRDWCDSQSSPWNYFSTVNYYLSRQEEERCVICASENPTFYDSDSGNANEVESSELAKSCQHRSISDGSILNYDITSNYFHNKNRTSELNLIELDAPNGISDFGKTLLKSWDDMGQ